MPMRHIQLQDPGIWEINIAMTEMLGKYDYTQVRHGPTLVIGSIAIVSRPYWVRALLFAVRGLRAGGLGQVLMTSASFVRLEFAIGEGEKTIRSRSWYVDFILLGPWRGGTKINSQSLAVCYR